MTPEELAERVRLGMPVAFEAVMAVVAENYAYRPCRFRNGVGADAVVNEAGTNEGSCKIFHLARLLGLDQQQTLALFGDFYQRDVLGTPTGTSHANIRRFMRDGWAGIAYEGVPLERETRGAARSE
jgi:hypothetical protein